MGLVRGARPWGLPGPGLLKFSPQTLTQGTLVPRSLGSPPRHRLDFLQAQGPLSCLHVGWSLRTGSWGDFLTRAATVSCSETPCGRPAPRPVPGGSWGQLSLPQRVSSREGPVSMADGDHERPRLWAGPLPTSVLKTRCLCVKWDRGPQEGFWRQIWLRETCAFSWACGQGSRGQETHLGRSWALRVPTLLLSARDQQSQPPQRTRPDLSVGPSRGALGQHVSRGPPGGQPGTVV